MDYSKSEQDRRNIRFKPLRGYNLLQMQKIPTYWTYKPIMGLALNAEWLNLALLGGICIHIVLVVILVSVFLKQMRK